MLYSPLINTTTARWVLLLALALAVLGPISASGQTTTLITLDSTELELVEPSARVTTTTFTIPAKLNAAKVNLRRWSISQDGRIIDRSGTTIELRPASESFVELFTSFNLLKLENAGRYVATLEFAAPNPVASVEGTKTGPTTVGQSVSATPRELEQTVQLKLNKPAAELRISTPVRIERTIYFLSFWGRPWTLKPDTLTLAEATGKSWVKISPIIWDVVLRHGDDASEEQPLRVHLPDKVDGWGQATATFGLEGPVSIGTTTGTLTIRAPQLSARTVDFAITLVSRLTPLWLVPVIALGIGLGWYMRIKLESERTRLAAVVPAEQELNTLDDLVQATSDPDFHKKLEGIRKDLAGKVDDKAGTAQSITAATAKAATDREGVVKEMNDLRDKIRTALDTWGRPCTVDDLLPNTVAGQLKILCDRLDALKKSFDAGSLKEVDDKITKEVPDLARKVREQLSDWLRQFTDVKAIKLAPWAELPVAAKVQALTAEADSLAPQVPTAETPEALWKVIIAAATFLVHLKHDLFINLRDRAITIATFVSGTLRKIDPAFESKAKDIDAATEILPDQSNAGANDDVSAFLNQLNHLHDTIAAALGSARKDNTQPLQGLEEGNFSTAVQALRQSLIPAEKDLGEGAAGPAAAQLQPAVDKPLPPAIPPKWKIVLEAPAATVGQPVSVRTRLIVPEGMTQPQVTLHWFRAGLEAGHAAPGTLERSFVFSEPGPVSISVVATDPQQITDSASLVLQVQSVHGALAISKVQETLAKVELVQNLASGAIIMAAGWLIFSPTFIGAFPEFFAAFLWGFGTDVGLAKVRDLAQPVMALKAPVPVPK
jgi:hypothetical protein